MDSPSLAVEEQQQVCQNFRQESLDDIVARNENGVFLTWKDLWVTVSGGKSILKGLTGYACPGQVLAIMGPSGCGKSTLLDALSGRLKSETKESGEILLNGQRQHLAYGTSAYVTQDDILTWTLTVREIVYYTAQLQLPKSMSMTDKRERAERTIRDMGLQNCIDTRIGGWGRKGLSSGEMRRVSICLEILTRPKLLFLDEPTSGIDSAASYHVVKKIINLAREYGMTIVTALHQPSSEVFKLLDNLCLLSSGKTMYFGSPYAADQFFEASGFACPMLQNPADHYLNIINTDFNEDLESGIGCKTNSKETIDLLAESYRSSDTWKEILRQIAEIPTRESVGMMTKEEGTQASFFLQCYVLTRRSFLNMYRDLGYYWLRLAIYIALGFGLGTVFYNIGNNYSYNYISINARGSLLMFVSSLLTIMAIGGFPSFIEEMKVFRRERLNGHYGVAAFILSNTISSTPFLLLISVIPGAIAYYLAGLHKGSERFSYFSLILLATIMLVESLMMIVASLVPNFLMGLITGAGIQGIMMLSGGFFRLRNDLPMVFWRYPLYYISFHKYAYQGLYKNEFVGLKFSYTNRLSSSSEGPPSWNMEGETILRDFWQIEMGYCKWIDLAILFGMVVLYRLLFFCIIKNGERFKHVRMMSW